MVQSVHLLAQEQLPLLHSDQCNHTPPGLVRIDEEWERLKWLSQPNVIPVTDKYL